ncbi:MULTISPECIES: hypothetical protein [Branchiibius]|uniref:Uncharacterized protein n=1 Tax=Branchiibius cervicis TaxID=908252 RepID=A0ABW2AYE3_9MICO|nr:hypothetical protein [Branchiibius hedensis]
MRRQAIDAVLASCEEDLDENEVANWLHEYHRDVLGVEPNRPEWLHFLRSARRQVLRDDITAADCPAFIRSLITHTCEAGNQRVHWYFEPTSTSAPTPAMHRRGWRGRFPNAEATALPLIAAAVLSNSVDRTGSGRAQT